MADLFPATLFLERCKGWKGMRTEVFWRARSPPMKKYKCVFNSRDKSHRMLVSGLRLESLTSPITISAKESVQEEAPRTTKRRSEVVEDGDGAREKAYDLYDADSRVYTSKKVSLSSNYFAFINVGTSLRVVPIDEWQRFSLKSAYNDILEDPVLPGVEEKEKEEEVEEIDYQDKFDDDDSEDEMQIQVEKKLSRAGRKMKRLMKTYEEQEQGLKVGDLREILGREKMTLKDLINGVKARFKVIDEKSKETIRNFIKEDCEVIEEPDGKYVRKRA